MSLTLRSGPQMVGRGEKDTDASQATQAQQRQQDKQGGTRQREVGGTDEPDVCQDSGWYDGRVGCGTQSENEKMNWEIRST